MPLLKLNRVSFYYEHDYMVPYKYRMNVLTIGSRTWFVVWSRIYFNPIDFEISNTQGTCKVKRFSVDNLKPC